MTVKLIDGPLDGIEIEVSRPQHEVIIIAIPQNESFELHNYFPWNDTMSIYCGKGNNVKRLDILMSVSNDILRNSPDILEETFSIKAQEQLSSKYGKRRTQLLGYRIHKTDRHSPQQNEKELIGIFDYYIYDK